MVDILKLFICSTLKTLVRCKNLGDISYICGAIAHFIPNFVSIAMPKKLPINAKILQISLTQIEL